MSLVKKNFFIKKIENGYMIEYYLDGVEYTHAFEDWKNVLNFLKDNPATHYEQIETKDFIEVV